MDVKQFNLFQQTVQYAIDEEKRATEPTEAESHFDMTNWVQFNDPELAPLDIAGLEGWFAVTNVSLSDCGTSACLAGTAVLLNGGDRFVVDAGIGENAVDATYVVTENGGFQSVSRRAGDLFGILNREADSLFSMTSDPIEALVDRCTWLAEKYGHKLEVVW